MINSSETNDEESTTTEMFFSSRHQSHQQQKDIMLTIPSHGRQNKDETEVCSRCYAIPKKRKVNRFVLLLGLASFFSRTNALLVPRNNHVKHSRKVFIGPLGDMGKNKTTRLSTAEKNATLSSRKKKTTGFLFFNKKSDTQLGAIVESTSSNETSEQQQQQQQLIETSSPPDQQQQQQKQTVPTESVHLKLGSQAMMARADDAQNDQEEHTDENTQKAAATAVLHVYRDPVSNRVLLKGFNMTRRKFCAWVNYTLALEDKPFDDSFVSTETIQVNDEEVKNDLRKLWKERRLLSERTEILAVYKSDKQETSSSSSSHREGTFKRGGFPDLLHLYAERLAAIIQDELEEEQIAKGQLKVFNDTTHGQEERPIPEELLEILNGGLLGWLEREYGVPETKKLSAKHFQTLSETKQFEVLQHFMDWFRSRFPYYYDRCDHCGASAKDEPEPAQAENDQPTSDDEDEEEEDTSSFLGYVYPTQEELIGKASRTEIYQCQKCGGFTRFPRYNSASSIINNKRGRCGEYSMLLFRLLRATGHEARWIVDWADHVWAEVRLGARWIHLDPCEAAVDKPLLYQEWGKQQTYIVAFRAPRQSSTKADTRHDSSPLIEDVTSKYTSDHVDEIQKRRDESSGDVQTTVGKITNDLELLLKNILQ